MRSYYGLGWALIQYLVSLEEGHLGQRNTHGMLKCVTFESSFFHLTYCIWDSSMMLLNSIPFYECTKVCLSILILQMFVHFFKVYFSLFLRLRKFYWSVNSTDSNVYHVFTVEPIQWAFFFYYSYCILQSYNLHLVPL